MIFNNNVGLICGGILLVNSVIIFFPGVNSFQFSHNSGSTGGAMAMFYRSQMIIQCGFAKLQFIDNHATQLGGAIYVQDLTLHNYFKVFYEVEQDMC